MLFSVPSRVCSCCVFVLCRTRALCYYIVFIVPYPSTWYVYTLAVCQYCCVLTPYFHRVLESCSYSYRALVPWAHTVHSNRVLAIFSGTVLSYRVRVVLVVYHALGVLCIHTAVYSCCVLKPSARIVYEYSYRVLAPRKG